MSTLTSVWQKEYGVCTADQYTEAYQQLCSSETPASTANTIPKQVMDGLFKQAITRCSCLFFVEVAQDHLTAFIKVKNTYN